MEIGGGKHGTIGGTMHGDGTGMQNPSATKTATGVSVQPTVPPRLPFRALAFFVRATAAAFDAIVCNLLVSPGRQVCFSDSRGPVFRYSRALIAQTTHST